uniref:avidin-related protein 1-like isoform X2 n=1 Tax=Myxine glutinosa TaxID=7769 RepID=UPI00358E006F
MYNIKSRYSVVQGGSCLLPGAWRNQFGSDLWLWAPGEGFSKNSPTSLRGEFRSAVAIHSGSGAGNETRSLMGSSGRYPGSPFTFSVIWRSGAVTVWVGQCFVNGISKEVLVTSWLLKEMAKSQKDNWKTTRIGNDAFQRIV